MREDLLYEPDLNNLVTNPDSIITPDSVIEIHYKRKKFPIKIVKDSTFQIYDSELNKELSPNTDGFYYYWSKFGVLASELVADVISIDIFDIVEPLIKKEQEEVTAQVSQICSLQYC